MLRVCKTAPREKQVWKLSVLFVSRDLSGAWTVVRAILDARGTKACSFPKADIKLANFALYGILLQLVVD